MPFVLSLSLLCAYAPAEPKVSLRQTGSVSSLLANLSRQAGTTLLVGEQRGREILIVALNEVPFSEAMKRIAWATYGRWETVSGGYRLVRDSDAEKAAEKRYASWQTSEAANAIDVLRDRVEKQGLAPDPDPTWVWPQDPARNGNQATAADRALSAALHEVKPASIIFTRPDTLCVYSDNPTPAQYAFSDGGRSALQAFNSLSKRADGAKAAHAVLNVDYRFGEGHAKLELYDAQGFRIDYVRAVFHPDTQHRPTKDYELADEVPTTPVPLSEASKFIVQHKVQSPWLPTPEDMKAEPELVERIRNPEKYEPMGTFATDVWLAAADWKHSNLVANIDDVYMFPYWTVQTPNLREAFRMAGGYNAEVQSGWVVARPSLASPPWNHRLDRQALGRLARAGRKSEMAALEDWSAFAATTVSIPDSWTVGTYLAYADSTSPRLREGWAVPRLLGTLTPDQRQALYANRPVLIRQVSNEARIALRQRALSVTEPTTNLRSQPTVRFPNGTPDVGVLRAQILGSGGYHVQWKDDRGSQQTFVTEANMPSFLRNAQQRQPNLLQSLSVRREASRLIHLFALMGPQDTVDLGTYYDYDFADPEFIPWSSLPAELRQRLLSSGS